MREPRLERTGRCKQALARPASSWQVNWNIDRFEITSYALVKAQGRPKVERWGDELVTVFFLSTTQHETVKSDTVAALKSFHKNMLDWLRTELFSNHDVYFLLLRLMQRNKLPDSKQFFKKEVCLLQVAYYHFQLTFSVKLNMNIAAKHLNDVCSLNANS